GKQAAQFSHRPRVRSIAGQADRRRSKLTGGRATISKGPEQGSGDDLRLWRKGGFIHCPKRQKPLEYRPFSRVSDANRFAMEELPPERLGGICMETDGLRVDSGGIRKLYESEAYP